MSGLCAYKDIFGAPGTGAHAYRFLGVAIVDVVLTVLAAWAIAWWFQWPIWKVAMILFLVGILMHRLFCVRTTVDRWLARLI